MSIRTLPFLAVGAVLLVAGCSGGGDSAAPAASETSAISVAPSSTPAAPPSTPASTPQATSTRQSASAGAIERYETFLHAVGKEDLATACEIAAPAAKKAEDEGFGPCEQTFPVTFQMISPAQKRALQGATVDQAKVKKDSATKVEIPASAVKATAKFTDSDLGDAVLEYRGGQWYVTD
ncbi:hypothetical protein [Amycolatopsis sp. GM8]|uniref:hypothetical protein n=1 Tax=Amycolatopsis sp. GM8 TaxID=2896530 RepID=UPI001F185DFF|nr:hypothetical protein [Amycolatopsis sp. GM8]